MSNKGVAAIILIVILVIAVFVVAIFLLPKTFLKSQGKLTFIVTVPKTTPPDDTIVLHYHLKKVPLTRIGDFKYQGMIDKSQFQEGEELKYGYSRGGFHPFGEKGVKEEALAVRKVMIGKENVIQDTVEEWKWLPSEALQEKDIPSLAGTKAFKSRKNFWKGVQFVDFWDSSWPYQYTSTINHLKTQGYKWIELAPPWDIKRTDPPEISNKDVKVPVYPDSKLREHIQVFKKAGFKVMLRIQVCCEPLSFEGRIDSWWQKLYDQLEKFIKYHADLAKEEKVDAIVISYDKGLPLDPKSPSFASTRWKKIIELAKSSGSLIGFETLAWGASYEDIIPGPGEFVDFWSELDFMGVSLWGNVVSIQNPNQDEIAKGMKVMLDKLEITYQKIGKPIVLIGVAYESRRGAGLEKGPETTYTWEQPEKVPVKYSSEEQAMIYEALMKQVADREYIEGVFPFGYWYVDAPLTVDMSIRGKMAERILSNWIKNIPD